MISKQDFRVGILTLPFIFGLLGGCGQYVFKEGEKQNLLITIRSKDTPMETVITNITRVVEDALAEVEGVEIIGSINKKGESTVILFFDKKHDIDAALEDVRKRVTLLVGLLPEKTGTPNISGKKWVDGQFIWMEDIWIEEDAP